MLARSYWLLLLVGAFACGDRQEPGPSAPQALTAAHSGTSRARALAAQEPPFTPPGDDHFGRAGALRYLERCLGGGRPDEALRMVVMIHGLGDRPRFDWFGGASAIRTPMRLILPEAPTPYGNGFAWFPFRVGDNDPEALAGGIAAAADQLAHAIALLRARRPTVGRPIVAGFSQGGMLSYALALRHTELVELSLPIAGLLPEPLWPADKPPRRRYPRIAAMHGDADAIVPIAEARRLHAHLRRLGYEAELREYRGVGHSITRAMEAATVALLETTARAIAGGAARR